MSAGMPDTSNGWSEEELSTVFVGGFPADASHRELDNICRFMPGYVNSKVDFRRGTTLFVRYDSRQSALAAIELLNGQDFDRANPGEPIRAAMAKSNMKNSDPPKPSYGQGHHAPASWNQPPPPHQPYPGRGPAHVISAVGAPRMAPRYEAPRAVAAAASWGGGYDAGPALKRPRIPEDQGNVDTVAVVGALEKGFDETSLNIMFSAQPGFVTFKGNARMGGGFAKFQSHEDALKAVEALSYEGVPAAMAKSSMSSPSGAPVGGAPVAAALTYDGGGYGGGKGGGYGGSGGAYGAAGAGAKGGRRAENPSEVDTVACIGAAEAGVDEDMLQEFFSRQPGFMVFKANKRMGGGFIKFASAALAAEATAAAADAGIPAAIARSSMSST